MQALDFGIHLTDGEVERLRSQPMGVTHPHAWYSMPGGNRLVPDLLVIKPPQGLVKGATPLVIPAETPAERRYLERALDRPMELRATPFGRTLVLPTIDLQSAPSSLPVLAKVMIYVFEPPRRGWPWVGLVAMARATDSEMTARGRYLSRFGKSVSEIGGLIADVLETVADVFGSGKN